MKTTSAVRAMQMVKQFRHNKSHLTQSSHGQVAPNDLAKSSSSLSDSGINSSPPLCVMNSIDFSADGSLLVTASDDESIHLYDQHLGELKETIYSKKYGVDLVRFMGSSSATVVCASKNCWDHTLRLLSLSDNQYLRYFKGHRDSVVSVAVCPKDDLFVSSSLDNTVRWWDPRTHVCQGMMTPSNPILRAPNSAPPKQRLPLAFDPAGLVLALGASEGIHLFDRRNVDLGPFMTFQIELSEGVHWTYAVFDPTGRYLLMSTNTALIVVLDAITGEKLHSLSSFVNGLGRNVEASFSPGGEFILAGSDDGTIHVWETATGEEITVWSGHEQPVQLVRWNPKLQLVASACSNLCLWLPRSTVD
eukprot:TRINITY_DN11465_c0_g1_i1.p1 TRINITY_DN11465_c0_g1~~TRINITY_DN11465_c0_g1_i1.p1  ORF type:complete len:424 (+),score=33.61 TRINITY_DN11465_c0_g1_i1:191-1273(+)